jgi:hypothetical protein
MEEDADGEGIRAGRKSMEEDAGIYGVIRGNCCCLKTEIIGMVAIACLILAF